MLDFTAFNPTARSQQDKRRGTFQQVNVVLTRKQRKRNKNKIKIATMIIQTTIFGVSNNACMNNINHELVSNMKNSQIAIETKHLKITGRN